MTDKQLDTLRDAIIAAARLRHDGHGWEREARTQIEKLLRDAHAIIACASCGEDDFDALGLKIHLSSCSAYAALR